MPGRVLFVDYENVASVDLAQVPADAIVLMFFGGLQKSVPRDFYKASRKLGERCIDIEIHGQGRNALDFHIAYYLGERLTLKSTEECVVLSKDKGFDPLIAHLRSRGFNVRRVGSQAEAFATVPKPVLPVSRAAAPVAKTPAKAAPKARASDSLSERIRRMWDMLRKADSKSRPRKRKGLVAHVGAHFKGTPAADIERIVNGMFAGGWIRETDGKLEYSA